MDYGYRITRTSDDVLFGLGLNEISILKAESNVTLLFIFRTCMYCIEQRKGLGLLEHDRHEQPIRIVILNLRAGHHW